MSANFTEIERKFLVWPVPHEKLVDFEHRFYKQGYVVTGDTEVRIRVQPATDEWFLAVKRGLGYVRDEVEVPVLPSEGRKLMEMAGPRVLEKTRYHLPNGYTLDELHGLLEGMWILEIETGEETPLLPELPACVQIMFEVTHNPSFKTQNLAGAPAFQSRPNPRFAYV